MKVLNQKLSNLSLWKAALFFIVVLGLFGVIMYYTKPYTSKLGMKRKKTTTTTQATPGEQGEVIVDENSGVPVGQMFYGGGYR